MRPLSASLDPETHEVRPQFNEDASLEWLPVEKRRVAFDKVGEVEVSTVFLGFNHGFGEVDLWFETMVFGGPLDLEMDRYATWDQAVKGHAEMVARVRDAAAQPD